MNVIFGEEKTANKSAGIIGQTISETKINSEDLKYLPQFSFIPRSLSLKRIFRDFNTDFTNFTEYFQSLKNSFTLK